MINPYSFTDRALQVGLNITLESHHINHANSKLIVKPNYPGFGIEVRYINKIMKELSVIYVRLINQYKFKYQTVISARFDKQDDDNQVLDETELFINLKINHNLTESDLDKTDVRSPSEHQIQQQEMKDSSWEFDKNNSMIVYIFKTGEMNGRYYVKTPLRSNAILNIENNDKFCFLGSILANLHPFINNDPNIVAKYRQYFNELNTQDFDFTNGFKCSDVHNFEKLNTLSINIFELIFYQDQNKWKDKKIPIESSKIDSDRVIDLIIYNNHYAIIKKLNVFQGDHHESFICWRCLNSYTSENMLILHKPKCENNDINTIRTSLESHIYWKKHFHKNPLYFRKYADFEADNEIENSSIGIKTTNIYRQNQKLNGYYIIPELEDV